MEPVDKKLYQRIKNKVWVEIPKHSAYRSGILVQKYKKSFKKKHGNKNPYLGKKPKKKGLARWFSENWVNQRGEVGYKYKSDIYRPERRITSNTPITHGELKKNEIKKARRTKKEKGRIYRFRPNAEKKKNKNTKKKKNTKKIKRNQITGGKRNAGAGHNSYKRLKNGKILFEDYPDFKPNITPKEIFKSGAFGGTYWRPIYSKVNRKNYKNRHKKYPSDWWKGIPANHLSSPNCDMKINKYGVKVGSSLEFWEDKGWINPKHPYGWVEWYCDFFTGKRCEDDERQIKRWKNLAGKKGRFRLWLCNTIMREGGNWNDLSIRPKFRQILLHWGYVLTGNDFKEQMKRNKNLSNKYMRKKNRTLRKSRRNKSSRTKRKVGGRRVRKRRTRRRNRRKGCNMNIKNLLKIFKRRKNTMRKKSIRKKRKISRKRKMQKGGNAILNNIPVGASIQNALSKVAAVQNAFDGAMISNTLQNYSAATI